MNVWSSASWTRCVKVFTLLAAFVVVIVGASSCIGEGELDAVSCPDRAVFDVVSPYLERRCGTLDCHGQPKRNLRIYGQLGLRLRDPNKPEDQQNVSGGIPTTDEERDANYAAVCNLEPEAMTSAVKKNGASAEQLLLVTKMRGLERHKGGQAVIPKSPGEECILLWLRPRVGTAVGPLCTAAVNELK